MHAYMSGFIWNVNMLTCYRSPWRETCYAMGYLSNRIVLCLLEYLICWSCLRNVLLDDWMSCLSPLPIFPFMPVESFSANLSLACADQRHDLPENILTCLNVFSSQFLCKWVGYLWAQDSEWPAWYREGFRVVLVEIKETMKGGEKEEERMCLQSQIKSLS